MVVGGEVFLAEVEEKKKALETYNEAVSKGQSAGNNSSQCSSLMKRRHNYALTGKNLFIKMKSPRTCGIERKGQQPVQHFCKRGGRSKS